MAGDNRLSLAISEGPSDAQALEDLTEAVGLALPLPWRRHWSYTTSVCDAATCKAPVKFMLLDYNIRQQPNIDARSLPALTEGPDISYVRLLKDAANKGFLADLLAARDGLEAASLASPRALAERLHHRLWKHYGLEPLWEAILKRDSAEAVRSLLGDIKPSDLDQRTLDASGLWQRMAGADGVSLLPNLAVLRAHLWVSDQPWIDQRAADVLQHAIAGAPDGTARLDLVERGLTGYPWQQAQAHQFLARAVSDGLQPKDAPALIALLNSVHRKFPEMADILLGLPQYDELLVAIGIAFRWISLGPKALPARTPATRSWRVSVQGREWVVRQRTALGAGDATITNFATQNPFIQLQVLQTADPTQKGRITVRPFIKGDSLTWVEKRLSPDHLVEALGQVAEGVAWLHQGNRYHGNIKSDNLICTSQGMVLVDETPEAATRAASQDLVRRDRIDIARVLFTAADAQGYATSARVQQAAIERAAVLQGRPLVEEVWGMIEREQVRKSILSLLAEDREIQQKMQDIARTTQDVRSQGVTSQDLRRELDNLQRRLDERLNQVANQVTALQKQQPALPGRGPSQQDNTIRDLRDELHRLQDGTRNDISRLTTRLDAMQQGSRRQQFEGEQQPSAAAHTTRTKTRREGDPGILPWLAVIFITLLLSLVLNFVVDRLFAPAGVPAGAPTVELTETPLFVTSASPTPRPTNTAQAATTPTDVPPSPTATGNTIGSSPQAQTATVKSEQLNIRSLPSMSSESRSVAIAGESFVAVGRDSTGTWLQVLYKGIYGWAAAEYIDLNGSIEDLPIIPAGTVPTDSGTPTPDVAVEVATRAPTSTR